MAHANQSENEKFRNWTPVGKGLIKRGKLIGKGGESSVFRGSFGKEHVALKVVSNSNEVEVLRNLDHENIIKYIYTEKVDTTTYIVLELCDCNLEQYVKHTNDGKGGNFQKPDLSAVEVLKQILAGVHYLHNGQSFCTVHRDLKPSNILFVFTKRSEEWTVKISDFGLSKDLDQSRSSTNSEVKGSRGWMSPELLQSNDETRKKMRVGKETDIFPLGIMFAYTLSDGVHPFGDDLCKVDENIRDGYPDLSKVKDEYKVEAVDLILAMLKKKPDKRPTASEIKAHFIFWTAEEKLAFYQEVSDILADRTKNQKLKNGLEKKCLEITGGNWREKISGPQNPAIAAAFERHSQGGVKPSPGKKNNTGGEGVSAENGDTEKEVKKKKKKSVPPVLDLIRQIRNWGHHYNDDKTKEELRKELGSYPDGLMEFFKSNFPLLLPHTYDVMKELKDNDRIKKYYGTSGSKVEKSIKVPNLACNFYKSDDDDDGEDILSLDPEKKVATEVSKIAEMKLRNYQMELAQQAKDGHNSLIIAPTGSGKTAVAYEIIRHHLSLSNSKSILFFVSKTTLALQQHEFFRRYLHQLDEKLIDHIIGENSTNAPVGAVLNGRRLVVLTPQILIDEMNRRKSSVKFSKFSLLIFDECHNATKKHPYKRVMDMLLDSQVHDPTPIQVVGMTASPGVGRGKTRDKVLENLVTLLANLNITQCPAIVQKNADELKRHQNEIEESHLKIRVDSDVYSLKILKAIELIEDCIRSEDLFGSRNDQVREPPKDKTKQTYEQWVVNLKNHVRLKITDKDKARAVSIYAEHLQMYYTLLYLKKHIPHAIQFTNVLASFDQDSEQGKYLRRIKTSLEKASINSKVPMLERLFEELNKQFTANKESKCIIFVPRKLIAKALAKSISDDPSLGYLKPQHLTGSNDQEASGGMTRTGQRDALEEFRNGKCKVLIATSVAEEGLDIRACNLVIMYNYVTGEVGRIQRAGRGRAENSRSILIAPYSSDQIERERKNEDCARASEDAIEDLKELTDEDRIKWVKRIQKKQARERKVAIEEAEKNLEEASKWQIKCAKCQANITTADHLREVKDKHKFVVDTAFESKVVRKGFYGEKPEITPGFLGVAKFICADHTCKNYLGIEMQCKNKKYPTLAVKQLIFEDEYGDRRTAKQWNKCPFRIERDTDDSDADDDDDEDRPRSTSGVKNSSKVVEADSISNETVSEYLNNWNLLS